MSTFHSLDILSMLYFLLIILTSAILTGILRIYAVRFGLVDKPGKRSSHIIPTPRGGGVSFVLIFSSYLLMILTGWVENFYEPAIIHSLFWGGLMIALMGFWDDHGHIRARWRLLVHFIVILFSISILPKLPIITLPGFNLRPGFLFLPVLVVGLVWMVNLFNFMDGSDGFASTEAILVSGSALLILLANDNRDFVQLLVFFMATITGFLIWNWPTAHIFMGDAGSGFLGAILGILALITSNSSAISLWSWLILLSVFWFDATYTLIQRLLVGETWYLAHRSHMYQILLRRFKSHQNVLFLLIVFHFVWLLPIAFLATKFPHFGIFFSLIAIIPLGFVANYMKAGMLNE